MHAWALQSLPLRPDGYTLDLDSFSLLHKDGHQEGARVGYARKGLKPCLRPLVAALAEVSQVAHFWLRLGNTVYVSGAATFLGDTLARLLANVRVALLRQRLAERLQARENNPSKCSATSSRHYRPICRRA